MITYFDIKDMLKEASHYKAVISIKDGDNANDDYCIIRDGEVETIIQLRESGKG